MCILILSNCNWFLRKHQRMNVEQTARKDVQSASELVMNHDEHPSCRACRLRKSGSCPIRIHDSSRAGFFGQRMASQVSESYEWSDLNETNWNWIDWNWNWIGWNEMKWNEMKWNDMKWNDMKWNEMNVCINEWMKNRDSLCTSQRGSKCDDSATEGVRHSSEALLYSVVCFSFFLGFCPSFVHERPIITSTLDLLVLVHTNQGHSIGQGAWRSAWLPGPLLKNEDGWC